MSVAGLPRWSLRLQQAESTRLAWAFALSVAIHLLIFGGYYTGKQFHWWENFEWPSWLRPIKTLAESLKKKTPPTPLQPQEPPLLFVDVSPAQQAPEPPKDAKYYSSRNSQAANPEPDDNSNVPKIAGEQTVIPKTEDTPRQQFKPLQPALPTPPAPDEQPEKKPAPTRPPGDLAMAKPDLNPKRDEGEDKDENKNKPSKPRTLQEAMLRQQEQSRLVGQKMKQEGGVRRRATITSVDAKATPFGSYDAALIEAVQSRWYTLLDQREYASDSRGKVVIQFHLHYDGRITELSIVENNVGEVLALICEKAIRDPSPYAPWPADMRLANRGDVRDIQFTFYYN
jgi:outer membrane biosynthesis protein TonB